MKRISKTLIVVGVAIGVTCGGGSSSPAAAQRTRTVGEPSTTTTTPPPAAQTTTTQPPGQVTTPKPAPAPPTFKAKYDGGIVGYGKSDGTLNFDDGNRRLVFRDKTNREKFSMPYDVVMAAWADTKSRRSTAGGVIASTVPYGLGLPGLFLKSKTRYLVLQYREPDPKAEGLAAFKLESKELLASVLYSFAEKAGLVQRGEAFVRRRDTPTPGTMSSQTQNPD